MDGVGVMEMVLIGDEFDEKLKWVWLVVKRG